jgi:hypothetical protein
MQQMKLEISDKAPNDELVLPNIIRVIESNWIRVVDNTASLREMTNIQAYA